MQIKGNTRILVIAIILLVIAVSFFMSGFSDTTGAFKLEARSPDFVITDVEVVESEFNVVLLNDGTSTNKVVIMDFFERTAGTEDEWKQIGNYYFSAGIREEKTEEFTQEWVQTVFGEREIKVVVDPYNKIREGNEDNNEYIFTFDVQTLNPDLHATDIKLNGDLLTATITNSGSATEASFKVKLYTVKDGVQTVVGEDIIEGLGAEASANAQSPLASLDGADTLGISIDIDRQVPEQNEDNNIFEKVLE
jgi:hypothetical protein